MIFDLFELEFLAFEIIVLADFVVVFLEVNLIQNVFITSFFKSLLDFSQFELSFDLVGG